MGRIIKERETRVSRTYRGGKLLDAFLGKQTCEDSFYPEDWISSFVEAKAKDYIPNEGLTLTEDGRLLADMVKKSDFGPGRTEPGVLIKLLDSCERLGIQVHPTDDYAMKLFRTPWGKTECWHILDTRTIDGETPKVYLGFKPGITRDMWEDYYRRQDVQAMLDAMHAVDVKAGDTVLVCGGTPHAIGAGCLMVEIQQPLDYTMRCETVPLSGPPYTPQQIHYGAGEEAMLDCFNYTPMTLEELEAKYLLKPAVTESDRFTRLDYVRYSDTPCFALSELQGEFSLREECFITLVVLENGGCMESNGIRYSLARGEKYFVPADTEIHCSNCKALVCYPPEKGDNQL